MIVALLCAGALLLALEWVLPGGLIGVAGIGCLIGGVAATYVKYGAGPGHMVLVAVMTVMVAGGLAWLRYFPHSKVGKVFVSEGQVGDAGYDYDGLKGSVGVAASDLRPSGAAEFDGRRYDVVADGAFVSRGADIKVVAVEGNRIVVRAVDLG